MGIKKNKEYDLDAIKHLGKALVQASPNIGEGKLPSIQANPEGLKKALNALPKKDKENIERFWGLMKGTTNHSKKIGVTPKKDVAFQEMFSKAVKSMRKLYLLDLLNMYDENFCILIRLVSRKINKNVVSPISELEVIKYFTAFFMFIWNGPRMSFEDDPMTIEDVDYGDSTCDEYTMLRDACMTLEEYPDNCVNLQLLIDFFEMLDFQDLLAFKKSLRFEIDEDCSQTCEPIEMLEVKRTLGINIPEDYALPFSAKEIVDVKTFAEIRAFKERVFKYGAWEITSALIIGNTVDLEMFMKELNKISRDWTKLENYKTHQKKIRTSTEIRTLDVYTIGGLEFTDPDEVCFLYASRELIEPKI